MRRVKPVSAVRAPRVSVVVPCFNYGRFLPEAVLSVLSQGGVEVDVLVVDDCSTDASQDVAARLAADDPRVSAIFHEQNLGHIATYNEGLAAVTGDYVVLLSADDLLAPGSLKRATDLMEANPAVGLVYGYAPGFSSSPPPFTPARTSWTIWSGASWIRRMCRRGTNMIVNPEAVLRGDVMRHLGGYRRDMPHAADMELWLRAAAISDVGRVNGPHQAYYRDHGGNMHHDREHGLLADDMIARAEVFEEFFRRHPQAIRPDGSLPMRTRRAIALDGVRMALTLVDGEDTTDVTRMAQAARRVDPTITQMGAWSRLDRARAANGRSLGLRLDTKLHQLRWAYRWQRWRRFGT